MDWSLPVMRPGFPAFPLKGILLLLALLGTSLGAGSLGLANRALAQSERPVSMELVLLIDVSASVNPTEYDLQALGLATAFDSPEVREAIQNTRGGLAISVIQWADKDSQAVAIDWTLVETGAEAGQLAGRLARMPRLIQGGHTALGDALSRALLELETNSFRGLRRVIDLSGDGRTNDGRPLRGARREVLDRGIVINGLAILNELPLLADFFREHLIGGQGAFVVTAADYQDFADVMREKLVREIGSMPVAKKPAPESAPPAVFARKTPAPH